MQAIVPLILLSSLAAPPAPASATAEYVVPLRGWILLTYDVDYLKDVIRRAPAYGVNHIQLSHDILHHADEAIDDEQKRRDVNELTALIHELGMKAFVWTHEIRRPDNAMMRDGRVVVDESVWPWFEKRYRDFFEACPDVDGLVMSFSEGDFSIEREDEVETDYTLEEMFRLLIGTIHRVCREHGKTLIVRKFDDAARDAILEAPEDLVVMQKCTIRDWQVYSANNPNLGTYGNHQQICEFDLAGEYVGQAEIPWCAPDYLQSRFRFAVGRNVDGMVARIDRNGRNALGTPNEINIDFFSELLRNPNADTDAFWREWCAKRFGEQAATAAERALRPTFDLTTRLYWGDRIGDWRIQEHSRIPRFGYAVSHDREYMYSPPVDTSLFAIPGRIESEMERRYGAIDARRVLDEFNANASLFREPDATWIRQYLTRLTDSIEAFRTTHTAFIRLRVYEHSGKAPVLLTSLKQDLENMRAVAERLDAAAYPRMEMVNSDRMRAFAAEVERSAGQ